LLVFHGVMGLQMVIHQSSITKISYDQSTGYFVTLATGVTEKFYTTQVPLISGQIYKFKIQARNTVGYSQMSEELSVLVA